MIMTSANRLWLGTFDDWFAHMQADQNLQQQLAVNPELYTRVENDEEEDPLQGYGYLLTPVGVEGEENVMLLSIRGTLVTEDSWINRYVGRVSYPEIINAATVASQYEGITDIVLDMGTPGGAANGISEAISHLKNITKTVPIHTFCGSQMCSGGYWLGSVGKPIQIADLAVLGSIGVISVHMEYTKMLEEMGISAEVLRSGKYKALGTPYEKYTEQARERDQRDMDVIYREFKRSVADNLGTTYEDVSDNMAEGQTFWGKEAVRVGLAHGTSSMDELVHSLIRKPQAGSGGDNSHSYGVTTEESTMPRIITDGAQSAILAGADPKAAAELLGEQVSDEELENRETAAAAEKNDAGGDVTDKEEGTEVGEGEGEGNESPEGTLITGQVVDTAVAALSAQIKELQSELIDSKVELKQVQTELTAVKAAVAPMRTIVIETTQRLQVGLRQAPTDLSNSSDSAVVDQFRVTEAAAQKEFPVGPQARANVGDAREASESSNVTTMERGSKAATRIGKK